MSTSPAKGHIDKISIGLSALCAVHCLVLPVVAGVLPAFAAVAAGHAHFHLLMLVLVIPMSGIALGAGWLRHRDGLVMALGLCGMALMVVAVTVGHDLLGHEGERWATLAGSFILAAGHFRNFRRCRPEDGCHKGAC
jgi:hypothetical protein